MYHKDIVLIILFIFIKKNNNFMLTEWITCIHKCTFSNQKLETKLNETLKYSTNKKAVRAPYNILIRLDASFFAWIVPPSGSCLFYELVSVFFLCICEVFFFFLTPLRSCNKQKSLSLNKLLKCIQMLYYLDYF